MFSNPDKNLAQLGLREGMRLADFGSGMGFYIKSASLRVGPTGRVYAIEIQKEILKTLEADVVRAGVTNVECIWGDIEKKGGSKLSDHSMDRVILSNVLFQVEDKLGLIDEAKRVLKKDGKLLLVDWKDSYGGIGPTKEMIITQENASNLFLKRGFKEEETISISAHHYGIIFTSHE
jgi:ubiquinone/menaquinone biosynthesis C-methylase UbiE